jgi:hypothetical protein
MSTTKCRPGIGAQFWVYKKKVHSQRVIKHRYPNYDAKVEKLEECLRLREGTAHSSHQIKDVYYFRHDDMPDREFYACRRFCHLTAEGAEQDIFGLASQTENAPEQAAVPPPLTARRRCSKIFSDGSNGWWWQHASTREHPPTPSHYDWRRR